MTQGHGCDQDQYLEASALLEWLATALSGLSSVADAERFVAHAAAEEHGLSLILSVIHRLGGGRRVLASSSGPIPQVITVTIGGSDPADVAALDCHLDGRGRLLGVQPALFGLTVNVRPCQTLETSTVGHLHELFEAAYDQADHAYLDRSLSELRYIATAVADDRLAGFSIGDARSLDIPGLGATHCLLSGLVCVDETYRRRGISRHLSSLAVRGGGVSMAQFTLAAARMAHPSSMRAFRHSPTTVPRRGHRPTDAQRASGAAVASAYMAAFDEETFVCKGSGRPIGYPRIVHDLDAEEWELFEQVDRDRGDSLLALTWQGGAPSGWDT